ncbi:MAG: DUF4250 domain-containing protein [Muribaculaceae bacterium]|nr:DUF4250 domain-containing protein [Muribaculaceae bacterium]MDE6682108.1 DUF4250 domain-containing protein [Muribaculaceae bacterium]
MNLPQDPFMLLSVINMKLRDEYPSLEELCKSNDIDEESLKATLLKAGFEYIPEANQFR